MLKTAIIALLGTLAVSLVAGLGAAHERNYLRTDVGLIVCVDDQFSLLGIGGAVGGALKTVGATLDPFAPDHGTVCYRKNHIVANANGDVSFSWLDQVQTNAGGCVSQDSDGDGGVCNDAGDIQKRGCNGVTVNVNFNDRDQVAEANAWRFQDAQGVPSRETTVSLVRISLGTALLGPIFPDCGENVDSFTTTGAVNHG